jgi:Fe2+ or Zn2+ uptake regulation protein
LQDETAGDPMTGLKWTRRTVRELTRRLRRQKFKVGRETVRRLLAQLKYAQRVNRKRLSRHQDPERDRQMRHILRQRQAFLRAKSW